MSKMKEKEDACPVLTRQQQVSLVDIASDYGVYLIRIRTWEEYYLATLVSLSDTERSEFYRNAEVHLNEIAWAIEVLPVLIDTFANDPVHGFLL